MEQLIKRLQMFNKFDVSFFPVSTNFWNRVPGYGFETGLNEIETMWRSVFLVGREKGGEKGGN